MSDGAGSVGGAVDVGPVLRQLAPRVLATLARRYGAWDQCEDATQEALLEASIRWAENGLPAEPTGWLITVARRRLTDRWRSDDARRRREIADFTRSGHDQVRPADQERRDADDTVQLLIMCCHPALTVPAQISLTLRAVGGLTTAQVGAALLISEATAATRISRAKQQIRAAGARFGRPDASDYRERLAAVLQVLHLIFTEGHTASSGSDLQRPDLAAEAIRITRVLHRADPEQDEVTGLLALMILTHARRDARIGPAGELIPADRQDRERWHHDEIAEGAVLVQQALAAGPVGRYQLEAAIAAVHGEADSVQSTDWEEILGLYRVLDQVDPGPMVTLGMAVAVAMVDGPVPAIRLAGTLADDPHLGDHHRRLSVLAHLHELAGDHELAQQLYRSALDRTHNRSEQDYLRSRLDA